MKKPTIYEIAKDSGVSPATVSRAIHSPHLLKPQTLEAIQKAMKRGRYTYNAAAANLSRGRSSTIHVFIPSLGSSVFTQTVMGIQEHAFKNGYTVVVASTNYDPRQEMKLLKQAVEQQCAGILLTGCCKSNEAKMRKLAADGLPVVVMWQDGPRGMASVGFDNFAVTRQAVRYILSLGHRRIGGIFGPCSTFSRAQVRLDAYIDEMRGHDLPIDPFLYSENRPNIEDGKRAMARLLELKSPPTAVFCTNDLQAVGAYDVIRRAGLRIPEDISVFGFDDIELAPYLTPPLSTVHVPSFAIGRQAAEFLLDILAGKSGPAHRSVDTPLVIRNSCAPPRRGTIARRGGACTIAASPNASCPIPGPIPGPTPGPTAPDPTAPGSTTPDPFARGLAHPLL